MIAEFMGPPGSGKTTLFDGIAADFAGRVFSAGEVNSYRLGLFGIPHKLKGKLLDRNFQRILRLSMMYQEKEPYEQWLVEKGTYSLLYAMHVREKRLLMKLASRRIERPTHLVVLLRAGVKRCEKDVEKEAAFGFDLKIKPFYDSVVKSAKNDGLELLVLDRFSPVEEDLAQIRAFLGER